MRTLVFLFSCGLIVASVWTTARLILGPVSVQVGKLEPVKRFFLSDFVWLVVLWQISLALSVQTRGIAENGYFLVVLTYLSCASLGLWIGSISFLSRAGVANAARRGCFTVVVLPGTLATMIVAPILAVAGSVGGLEYVARVISGVEVIEAMTLVIGTFSAVGFLVATTGIGWTLRQLSLWVASAEKSPIGEPEKPRK